MNKIVTINIGGIAIIIEEDAYDVLRDYLKNIGNHFENTENGDEIIADIELRVAEMLESKLKAPKISINVSDVKDVAETMGYPADFEEDETEKKEEKHQQADPASKSSESRRRTRKLFRDGENKQIGGVCAGLAKYFDFDPTVLRILWVISLLVFGFGFWIYIILWAILPEATTAAQKLEMMGESPNVENIKNTIHSEAKAAYERIATPENRKSISRFVDSVFEFLSRGFGLFFRLFAMVAFIGIVILLVVSLIGFLFNGNWMGMGHSYAVDGRTFGLIMTSPGSWVFKIAMYLTVAVPLLYIAIQILPQVFSVSKPTKTVKQALLTGWILAIVVAIVGLFYSARQYHTAADVVATEKIALDSDTIIVRIDDLLMENHIKTDTRVKLDVVQASDNDVELKVLKSARSHSYASAQKSTEHIINAYKLNGNNFLLSERVLLDDRGSANLANLYLTLRIPVGKTIIFHESTKRVINDIKNLQNIYDPNMAGHTFFMAQAGLRCEDCSATSNKYEKNATLDNFSKIEIEGALRVKIVEGQAIDIHIPTREDGREWVEYEIRNDRLEISQKSGFVSNLDNEIVITTPDLKSLNLQGACTVDITSAEGDKGFLDVESEGASSLKIHDLHANKLSVNMDGVSNCEVDGAVDLLLLDLSGASAFTSVELACDHANISIDGACVAKVNVDKDITGQVDGGAMLYYKGQAVVKAKSTRASQILRLD